MADNYFDPWGWRSDMDAPKIENYLRQGPAPTGHDKVFDSVYGWLGGLPENRSTASALTNLFDIGTLGMATGAYDGGRELAASGDPNKLALALIPGAVSARVASPAARAAANRAAVAMGGKVYVGPTHMHALDAAERHLKLPPSDFDKMLSGASDGFVINGRFLTRDEAAKAIGTPGEYVGSENAFDLDFLEKQGRRVFRRAPGRKVRRGDLLGGEQ